MLEDYIVKIDGSGEVVLSQAIMKRFKLKAGDNVRIKHEEGCLVLIP